LPTLEAVQKELGEVKKAIEAGLTLSSSTRTMTIFLTRSTNQSYYMSCQIKGPRLRRQRKPKRLLPSLKLRYVKPQYLLKQLGIYI
jgi:hypothetical protein